MANFENGDIEVQYTVSNFKELEELIIKWLPKIKVLSPRPLKKMIKKALEPKMKSLLDSP